MSEPQFLCTRLGSTVPSALEFQAAGIHASLTRGSARQRWAQSWDTGTNSSSHPSSASLTSVKKKDGEHRPVAGETLRRLKAKVLLATVTKDGTHFLHPTQLGLGTPSGCAAITLPTKTGASWPWTSRVPPTRSTGLRERGLLAILEERAHAVATSGPVDMAFHLDDGFVYGTDKATEAWTTEASN